MKRFNEMRTSDSALRQSLTCNLERELKLSKNTKIIQEFGLRHGASRIDIAVVNGVIHGYELKSDCDTLERLPEQAVIYNSVLDKVTLVVGKRHLRKAIYLVPDWWGIVIAKVDAEGQVVFRHIRKEGFNSNRNSIAIAELLWKSEALQILAELGEDKGYYSKTRGLIYKKLVSVLDQEILCKKVREAIFLRSDWRSDTTLMLNGG